MSHILAWLPIWTPRALAIAAAAGPVTHYCFWMRFVVDDYVEWLLVLFVLLQPILIYSLCFLDDSPFFQAYLLSCLIQAAYYSALAASTGFYRLFTHPLRRFPGPFWARLSSFWKIRAFAQYKTKCYLVFDDLHKEYGDVVRIGK